MRWFISALAVSLAIFVASLWIGVSYTAPSGAYHFEVWEAHFGLVRYPPDQWAARQQSMGSGWTPIFGFDGIRWLPPPRFTISLPLWMPVAVAAIAAGTVYSIRAERRKPPAACAARPRQGASASDQP